MEHSGFFEAEQDVSGIYDRQYKAEQFAKYFSAFIGNGVYPNPSTGLQVCANGSDMKVYIKSGMGFINGYFYYIDSDLYFLLDKADGAANRIDRLVLRHDVAGRIISASVKKGTYASTPAAATIQRDADFYELALSDVYVGAGVTSITQSNITDQRMNSALCGIVKGLIEDIDTTDLFAQYNDEFTRWFANLHTQLDTEVATHLQNECDTLDSLVEHTFNMTTSGTNHALPDIGSYKYLRIKADADYLYGDTFSINGTTVTACMQNGQPLPYKYFTAGNYVSCVLNGTKLNFKSAGGGGMLDYNLYAQPAEPEKKEGIWIKSDHGYTGITVDTQMYLANSWMPNQFTLPPSTFTPTGRGIQVGRNIYVAGLTTGSSYYGLYKYNIDTNTWTQMANPNRQCGSMLLQYGDYLYDVNGYDDGSLMHMFAYRYSITNNTWETLATCVLSDATTSGDMFQGVIIVDGKIYGFPKGIYYTIATNTWGQDTTDTEVLEIAGNGGDYNVSNGIGTKIYWESRWNTIKCHDVVTKVTTGVAVPYSTSGSQKGLTLALGTDLYFIGFCGESSTGVYYPYGKKCYKLDTLTMTFASVPDMPAFFDYMGIFFIDSVIHVVNGKAASSTTTNYGVTINFTPFHYGFSFNSKQYSEDTFVLLRTSNSAGNYLTELATAKGITGSYTRFPSWFNDAILFYGGTLHGDLPSYYGDGSQWCKFKN